MIIHVIIIKYEFTLPIIILWSLLVYKYKACVSTRPVSFTFIGYYPSHLGSPVASFARQIAAFFFAPAQMLSLVECLRSIWTMPVPISI